MASITLSEYAPWTDRNGRFSALRLAVFLLACAPAFWMTLKWNMGWLSPKPITDILRESGDWAMRFTVIVLAVSPFRDATRWNRIIAVRRMLGLATMFYIIVHLSFYVIDQRFVVWRIALELVLRTYLTIGLIAVIIFAVMALSSNDTAVRRLGAERWNRRHSLIYLAATLAIVHYFMQVRLKAWEPSLIAGLLIALGGYRLWKKYIGDVPLAAIAGLTLLSAIATALTEAAYYRFSMNAPFDVVLNSNFDFSYEIRPAWYALAAGIAFALVSLGKKFAAKFSGRSPAFPRKTETAPHR